MDFSWTFSMPNKYILRLVHCCLVLRRGLVVDLAVQVLHRDLVERLAVRVDIELRLRTLPIRIADEAEI